MEHGMNTDWGGRASPRDPNFAWVAADSERWGLARTLALPNLDRPQDRRGEFYESPFLSIRVSSVAPYSAFGGFRNPHSAIRIPQNLTTDDTDGCGCETLFIR